MFCQSCGSEISEGMSFCVNCGAPVTIAPDGQTPAQANPQEAPNQAAPAAQPQTQPQTQPVIKPFITNTVIPFVKAHKLPVGIGGGVLALIIILCVVASSLTNPKNVAERYFKAYRDSDWSSMYGLIALEDGALLTKEQFILSRNTLGIDNSDIGSFTVAEYQSQSPNTIFGQSSSATTDDTYKKYTVTYFRTGSNYPDTMTIKLIKQPGKKWLFFPDYRVEAEGLVTECSITAIEGSEVAIDGIKLTPTENDPDDHVDRYSIDYIFKGVHTVTVNHPQCKTLEETLDLSYGSDSLRCTTLELKDDVSAALKDTAQQVVREFCIGASEQKPFEELNIKMTSDESYLETLKKIYQTYCQSFKDDRGAGAVDFKITSMEDKTSHDVEEIGPSTAYVCDIGFDYTFYALYMKNGSLTKYTEPFERTGYFMPVFVCENGEWVLRNFYSFNFNLRYYVFY